MHSIPDLLRQKEYGINLRDIQWLDYWEEDGFEKLLRVIEHVRLGAEPQESQLAAEELSVGKAEVLEVQVVSDAGSSSIPDLGKNEGGPLNEAKLILVGFGEVGKTSLVNRLVYGKFIENEKKTEGIVTTPWHLRLRNEEDVLVHIWDFGGQDIMHSTHQFFLTDRSLYLLVLNGRQGHEQADAEYWLNLIESFGSDSSVIVVLNKIKQHPFDVNRRGLQQKFPIRDFVCADCQDGTGIDQLYNCIRDEIDRLQDLRVPFPVSWFLVKDRLAEMREDYLTYEYYRQVCRESGEGDLKRQDQLSTFLHRLGIALNYKDDPRLRDTHVLNPRWVTEGIYKILNSAALAAQKGELLVGDLCHILDPSQYPPERHGFLLELMRKFELCFPFPEDEFRYLIPERLDIQQPPESDEFSKEECLNFQYHYPSLPEGIIPRFIVRSHILSRNLPRWRTGVILEKEGYRALIKADILDRRVTISVAGSVADARRRLLAIVRSDFEHIHSEFQFEIQEMVPVPSYPDLLVSYRELSVMEQGGLTKFPKVFGNQVLELDVLKLLNGVDIERSQRRVRVSNQDKATRDALNIFYIYSRKDEVLRDELETHLKLLQRQGFINQWSDRQIKAGSDWNKEIDRNLEEADIILLLISADFIASDYAYDIEMERALERHMAGEAKVVPVILRDVGWKSAPFGELEVLPKGGNPVTKWDDRDTVWRCVEEGIREVVRAIIQSR